MDCGRTSPRYLHGSADKSFTLAHINDLESATKLSSNMQVTGLFQDINAKPLKASVTLSCLTFNIRQNKDLFELAVMSPSGSQTFVCREFSIDVTFVNYTLRKIAREK
jgi:hypothetical protein